MLGSVTVKRKGNKWDWAAREAELLWNLKERLSKPLKKFQSWGGTLKLSRIEEKGLSL